jgi:methylated-DNA-[protein]-cysteine S-methyltransferase
MKTSVEYTWMDSPIGRIGVAWSPEGLVSVWIARGGATKEPIADWTFSPRGSCDAVRQLRAYFDGTLRRFDVPLAVDGTPFQKRVWSAVSAIPFGRTVSYSDVARRIGRPRAVRAVGAANARNPVPIVVPCHRVVGRDGKLRGYAGGLPAKAALLDFERRLGG